MQSRRTFIRTSLLGSAGAVTLCALPAELLAKVDVVKLSVLHTNDMHSHIEPFEANDPDYPGLGGMARRAALISHIRNNEPNVILLDAGDVFQGTPYFNIYGGELEFKLMSGMGYDACMIGNHDFDNGLEGLVKMLPHANFPFVCVNYDFSDTPMSGKTIPTKIIEKEGLRIGIFGIGIELNGLVDKRFYGNTIYNDPVIAAENTAYLLKKEKACDFVICLSHLGYKYESSKIDDLKLASATANIDLIIGGHTHTFLDTPVEVKNRKSKPVLVNQVGWAGLRLGKIDFYFQRNNKKKISHNSAALIIKKIMMG